MSLGNPGLIETNTPFINAQCTQLCFKKIWLPTLEYHNTQHNIVTPPQSIQTSNWLQTNDTYLKQLHSATCIIDGKHFNITHTYDTIKYMYVLHSHYTKSKACSIHFSELDTFIITVNNQQFAYHKQKSCTLSHISLAIVSLDIL